MIPAILFPAFDPVAFAIGPFVVRWYALAYIAGIVIGWQVARRLVGLVPVAGTREQVDDFVTWATLGVILGGRIGYVLFYRPDIILNAPWEIAYLWHGGMSFHGGAAGVIVALAWFCHRQRIPFLLFSDRITSVVPIGLGLGRIANFINGELWGRTTDVPWGMIFPHAGPEPRHPSQLYQAAMEGLILLVVLQVIVRTPRLRARPGFTAGAFLTGYGMARIIGEFFRQPDPQLGFLFAGATMGQLLSIPMVLFGIWLMWRSKPVAEAPAA
ncbi:phosphatidylglycerol:prolipoprotein diacylglycerol transferase [Roseomonas rosea]|uniref:Phosphatidylglycerol--prolipoprotein diacylglyceryl transferase n=1 Tax=Muricoccus roseus TaxID=198092 RepID=A0A1M6CKX4_9PROT|nr:prolipoprotein diacylglyceryl transferase [Roseomonas rosea]SHI61563.1 phosphatidylglycerol:prolipoprotein diacylglycerol transferase [Roseomonas rosea]